MVRPRQVTVLAGPTFMVSDARGDVTLAGDLPEGLFHRDMRHLSQWALRVNGRALEVLGAVETDSDHAVMYLQEPTGTIYTNPTLSIVRRRRIDRGLHETLEVTSHDTEQVRVGLTLAFGADFADVFEVKDKLGKAGVLYHRLGDDHAVLGYRREEFRRETQVHAGAGFYTRESVEFQLVLEPGETWTRDIEVMVDTGSDAAPNRPADEPLLAEWLAAAPRLETDSDDVRHLYRQSLVDLAALRFCPDPHAEGMVPAAGLPWFMALFGRDSLIASYQALPYAPGLARATLHALAACQATEFDDFRDAEPGKILHELRHGELVHFGQRPHSPYYGSVDATPLFLVLLDEYERWSGDVETVRALEPHARAAVRWLDEYADLDGDGFIEYATRNPATGLVNQGWKDSWNSIIHPDGRIASRPHAVCEVQGYAYDARVRTARLAREVWGDTALAERLEQDAAALRSRFVDAFWLPDLGFYALALDADKQPVRTLASDMGHLLWSGIVPEEHVDAVVGHLLGDAMFSGWGVRTLAAGQPAYNPVEYHNGTVWPHDNALIVAGLTRYGRRAEAARIARALLDAGPYVDHRLPEALVGASRDDVEVPVPYPSACSPQAWAAGTTLMLITAVLGLDIGDDGIRTAPHLPDRVGRLALHGVPTRFGRLSTD
ncbi:glycogen debranching N-terminal domain-containing protein [Nocardioides pocheonensis]|uniref:Amylo-alpha-1,6-glucosidase n=1 Tax=Nocardioides pocheonensis TaxID=661485 RepID=A0A3N0GME1_9ACTN|nr:glycogen debranching N-terminal domain-containing protein [Nocardioides pocheonensis]RNM13644.1 amylo-alpha-1,6-glucosidase [Nocardioides pocheonensis]